MKKIEFTKINNDGNPRFVCHFLNLLTKTEINDPKPNYNLALSRAKKLGGKKFHDAVIRNKQYGGGIVFQTESLDCLNYDINKLLKTLK